MLQDKKTLKKALEEHDEKVYPFHMPGHKRQVEWFQNPYKYDITEIDGFDNLYEAEGLLSDIQQKARRLYGSNATYLLVNGSTVGNLVAIFAATKQGDTIIIGRACHKSVYNAVQLRQLKVGYVTPDISSIGFSLRTPLAEYERAIKHFPEAKAIVITSPTYEGIIEDVPKIAKLAHENNMLLIVDAAHGAHLGLDIAKGADIVIMSLHKTLPALTQTALLHLCKENQALRIKVKQYLEMFQTSSPSYLLMASIEKCIDFTNNELDRFEEYASRLREFYKKCEELNKIRVRMYLHQDPSKIIIDCSGTDITGKQLKKKLREQFNIEIEMASFLYGLAMTSVMDKQEAFDRLFEAIEEIDKHVKITDERNAVGLERIFFTNQKRMEMHEALNQLEGAKEVPIDKASGHTAASTVAIYPPAIPLFVPGELITQEKTAFLKEALEIGLNVTGLFKNKVKVI